MKPIFYIYWLCTDINVDYRLRRRTKPLVYILCILYVVCFGECDKCVWNFTVSSKILAGKAVYQSSVDAEWEGYPEKAVDGYFGGHLVNTLSCALTQTEVNPWWAIDLGVLYFLKGMFLRNRNDCCGMSYLS